MAQFEYQFYAILESSNEIKSSPADAHQTVLCNSLESIFLNLASVENIFIVWIELRISYWIGLLQNFLYIVGDGFKYRRSTSLMDSFFSFASIYWL